MAYFAPSQGKKIHSQQITHNKKSLLCEMEININFMEKKTNKHTHKKYYVPANNNNNKNNNNKYNE
jgi:hypothetical protein